MIRVRAKFKCMSETRFAYGDEGTKTYKFQAMYDPDLPEDKSFSKYTPSGSLEISVDKPTVQFQVGKDYYLDITAVDQTAGQFATRDELVTLLGEDADERAVLEIVLDRLTNHGVDVNALVKVTVDLIDETHEDHR